APMERLESLGTVFSWECGNRKRSQRKASFYVELSASLDFTECVSSSASPQWANNGAAMTEFPRFDLTGQIALVTGAARGLGRAISLALAHAGADVALGLRKADSANDLVQEIQAMGRKALPLQMDVTHLGQIFRSVEEAVSHFGRLDILVNNAGIAPE